MDKQAVLARAEGRFATKAVFDEIIDVCYHASMLTEEGRPTVFRIVFLDSQSRVSPRDDDERRRSRRYILKEPVPFTQGELRRLAPVADPRRVLIAVEQSGGRLQIYGLVDYRHGSVGDWPGTSELWVTRSPEALVVMSTLARRAEHFSPGTGRCFGCATGDRNGGAKRLAGKGQSPSFRRGVRGIHPQCLPAIGHRSRPGRGRRAELRHQSFIESVLLYTAELKHGGTLLFVPEEMTHEDSRLLSRVSIKYGVTQHTTAKCSGVGNGDEG